MRVSSGTSLLLALRSSGVGGSGCEGRQDQHFSFRSRSGKRSDLSVLSECGRGAGLWDKSWSQIHSIYTQVDGKREGNREAGRSPDLELPRMTPWRELGASQPSSGRVPLQGDLPCALGLGGGAGLSTAEAMLPGTDPRPSSCMCDPGSGGQGQEQDEEREAPGDQNLRRPSLSRLCQCRVGTCVMLAVTVSLKFVP